MTKAGQYTKKIQVSMTPQMHQFLKLMAERNKVSMNELIRQAIREHLDKQEDIIGSRSRLGRTVMGQLGKMHHELLNQFRHLTRLVLAGIIILMMDRGYEAKDVARQIADLSRQPGIEKMLDATK